MSIIHPDPHTYLRRMVFRKGTIAILAFSGILIISVVSFIFKNLVLSVVGSVLLLVLFMVNYDSFLKYLLGFIGEFRVKGIIDSHEHILGYHNIILPGEYSNIDHVILTKQGVICVETKSFGGKLSIYQGKWYYGGEMKWNPMQQVTQNSKKLKEYFDKNGVDPEIVRSGIVVLGVLPAKLIRKDRYKTVFTYRQLSRYLLNLPYWDLDRLELEKAKSLLEQLKKHS
ncbi:NERD domain-containing protein [Candidatus Dojkabacteria bacterium]|uniref:NERD domain-containing protein n=1 Tax=Candidatus Dojkabacteria bacterium TaxID=2099670 RepID=A0A955RL83_9BACT|nr:NERD domain-containing protein [Candidatus Dojkabacteria bacterium]